MRAALFCLLLAGCTLYEVDRGEGEGHLRTRGILFGQASLTACPPGGSTKTTSSGAANTTGDTASPSAEAALDVTGPCDHAEGGPLSTTTAAVFIVGIMAAAGILAGVAF